ncbi:MAG: hypothetical protein U0Y96_05410 [Candidatus Kapaibacterium sp.]
MKTLFVVVCASAVLLLQSCSDSTSTSTTMQFSAEITNPVVSAPAQQKGNSVQAGSTVDSVKITRVRMLLSRLILHKSSQDTSGGSSTVKAGPFLLDAKAGSTTVITSAEIPAGSYQNIKYELHKFSSSEVEQYLTDANFAPFVTTNRYSVILEGTSYKGGVEKAFVYNSDVNSNLSLDLQTAISVASGGTGNIVLQFQPLIVFKGTSGVLDPTDTKNKSDIDNYIKVAVKAVKK